MPASYAHLTLVAKMRNLMEQLPSEVRLSFLYYPHFCDLGAVSPDYPYLVLGDEAANKWADWMHNIQVVELLNAGVKRLRSIQGPERRKCLSWFLGYVSHVVLDMTIHPVVKLKVGPYKGNETAHRVCELHQDSYIFPQLNLSEVGVPEYFDSGIGRCTSKQSPRSLHEGVRNLWQGMLKDAHPEEFRKNPPEIDLWHRRFLFVMDNIASEGYRFVTWARHLGVNSGLTYPRPTEVEAQYIDGIATPEGPMGYADIFERGRENVLAMWQLIDQQFAGSDEPELASSRGWDLDTGLKDDGKHVYWEEA
jgi:hypothetical protein